MRLCETMRNHWANHNKYRDQKNRSFVSGLLFHQFHPFQGIISVGAGFKRCMELCNSGGQKLLLDRISKFGASLPLYFSQYVLFGEVCYSEAASTAVEKISVDAVENNFVAKEDATRV
ncbi:unnamed protein product [Thlaspi arvense]|uniref:Uncharacterized protein n=1 Tax=Thlaspi arvense TaxID=13288 RepID=A0AAU9T4W6_THLAR|nr:unnamed protein product [Thlaspi arvense]